MQSTEVCIEPLDQENIIVSGDMVIKMVIN